MAVPFQEMIRQERDVVSPFPQGRNENLDRIDAVKQVLPETAVLYGGMKVGISCADQPDIDGSLLGRSPGGLSFAVRSP